MVHILKQKGALLCALLILLTALPLAAQRKRRAAALPALPDTVYLLDHDQESRHWMRDLDEIKHAIKVKRKAKEMINAGWEFLAPAWRGVQDSASYPAFRYYYASFHDELYSHAIPRLLAFYVKEEPVDRSKEWLRGVKFTPMNRLDRLVDYEKSDVSRLPKQIYIVRVTGDSVRLYSVFHTACSRGGSDYCVLSIGGAPINPESLQVVGFSDRFAAPGTEGASSVAACEEAFGQCRRLRAHNLTVPWLSYYICYEDGEYHTEDKCDPAYVSSPPSDEEIAANRKRGVQVSAAYPAFRYYYASFDDELYSGANPRLLAFYVKEEPMERSQEWLRGVKFTSMKLLDKLVSDYTYDLRCLPRQIYIVRVTSEGIRVYPVFHTRYCQENVFGLYYTAPSGAINPESLHPVLLNTRGYIPCAEEVPSAVSEEALEQSRRLKKLGLDLKWLSYRTSKEGGRYAVGSD